MLDSDYFLRAADSMSSEPIVGLLLICIGYTIKTIYLNFDEFMETYYYNPSTLAIVIGFFIFIVALFGCIGALKESTFLVNSYAFFLTIIFILQLSVSIAAYAMRSNIENSVHSNMLQAMKYYDVSYNAFTWNSTQYNLQCCGIYSYGEWSLYSNRSGFALTSIVKDKHTTLYVPTTCCMNEQCSYDSLFKDGCLNRLVYVVSQCALLLGVGALCVAFIQVLGIVFASMLAKSIRKVKTQRLVEREERRRNFYDQVVKNQEAKPKTPMLYTPKDSEA
ncbi:CD63 antigen isoform X2 [Dendroctonus ponderosae]|uniref:CD63 antigen isoform X2 n=1 Tax=Dendroctonus ponderosae TaxID=77166 RepID=UPI00203615AA|nr:CD63 antigen isoform X2 [Dendroctonus ponderosae]